MCDQNFKVPTTKRIWKKICWPSMFLKLKLNTVNIILLRLLKQWHICTLLWHIALDLMKIYYEFLPNVGNILNVTRVKTFYLPFAWACASTILTTCLYPLPPILLTFPTFKNKLFNLDFMMQILNSGTPIHAIASLLLQ